MVPLVMASSPGVEGSALIPAPSTGSQGPAQTVMNNSVTTECHRPSELYHFLGKGGWFSPVSASYGKMTLLNYIAENRDCAFSMTLDLNYIHFLFMV